MYMTSAVRLAIVALAFMVTVGIQGPVTALAFDKPGVGGPGGAQTPQIHIRLAQVEKKRKSEKDGSKAHKKKKKEAKKKRNKEKRRAAVKAKKRANASKRKARQAEKARAKAQKRARKAKAAKSKANRKAKAAKRKAQKAKKARARAKQQTQNLKAARAKANQDARAAKRKAKKARAKAQQRKRKALRNSDVARGIDRRRPTENVQRRRNAENRAERRQRLENGDSRRRARRANEAQREARQRRRQFQSERVRRRARQTVVRNTSRQRVVNRLVRDARGREHIASIRRFRAIDRRHRNRFRRGVSVYYMPPVAGIALSAYLLNAANASYDDYVYALSAPPLAPRGRRYELDTIISDPGIRSYARPIDLNTIEFAFGSADLTYGAIDQLEELAEAMLEVLDDDPEQLFLVAGHTDAVGSFENNLELSEERAASVVEVLVAEFGVPARKLEAVGYGEQYLRINTSGPERRNRRVVVRAIGGLLEGRTSSSRFAE